LRISIIKTLISFVFALLAISIYVNSKQMFPWQPQLLPSCTDDKVLTILQKTTQKQSKSLSLMAHTKVDFSFENIKLKDTSPLKKTCSSDLYLIQDKKKTSLSHPTFSIYSKKKGTFNVQIHNLYGSQNENNNTGKK